MTKTKTPKSPPQTPGSTPIVQTMEDMIAMVNDALAQGHATLCLGTCGQAIKKEDEYRILAHPTPEGPRFIGAMHVLCPWVPPFCSNDTDLACPACKSPGSVRVREKETYFDADAVEAYCAECHVDLEVQSSVVIEFSDPEEVAP